VQVVEGVDCIYKDNVYVPNVFSPDADNINDEFLISFGPDLDLLGATLLVYDRWGSLMVESGELPLSWNGFHKEKPVNPGVYIWLLRYDYLAGGKERSTALTGSVTLIR
jgi:gliding motility-associated-like protein